MPKIVRACLFVAGGLFAVNCWFNFQLFGRPWSISNIDELKSPAKVVRWDEHGLVLADGRHVMPSGMRKLPKESAMLTIATQRGVEVTPDGKVYGLVHIWHQCGNDPVGYDLTRVDLAKMLAYHQEGESEMQPRRYADRTFLQMGGGKERGWAEYGYVRMKHSFDSVSSQ